MDFSMANVNTFIDNNKLINVYHFSIGLYTRGMPLQLSKIEPCV